MLTYKILPRQLLLLRAFVFFSFQAPQTEGDQSQRIPISEKSFWVGHFTVNSTTRQKVDKQAVPCEHSLDPPATRSTTPPNSWSWCH